ncbi:redoxin domain-containing protein [Armatimonas sp.]|uniref:redoxin domain-containing protein n=1 Tax=Armatimonas sp. TaxID=1872638 RepID=UPI00374CC286
MKFFHVQEKAQRVTGKLPAKALCLICSQSGEGEEKPAGAASYKGKTYYFCNTGEIERFLKDPEAFIPAPVPRPAPPFALKTPTGETVTLESPALRGKLMLVDFWATWCVPCVKAMPELQKLQAKYAGKGFTVIGISLDGEGAKKVVPFLAKSKTKFTYPILLNGETIWQAWGVKSVPSVLLVKDGQILKHWSGQIDVKEIEIKLKETLAL